MAVRAASRARSRARACRRSRTRRTRGSRSGRCTAGRLRRFVDSSSSPQGQPPPVARRAMLHYHPVTDPVTGFGEIAGRRVAEVAYTLTLAAHQRPLPDPLRDARRRPRGLGLARRAPDPDGWRDRARRGRAARDRGLVRADAPPATAPGRGRAARGGLLRRTRRRRRATTRSPTSRARSTRCGSSSAGSRTPAGRSSPTPRTSCGRRSRRSAASSSSPRSTMPSPEARDGFLATMREQVDRLDEARQRPARPLPSRRGRRRRRAGGHRARGDRGGLRARAAGRRCPARLDCDGVPRRRRGARAWGRRARPADPARAARQLAAPHARRASRIVVTVDERRRHGAPRGVRQRPGHRR